MPFFNESMNYMPVDPNEISLIPKALLADIKNFNRQHLKEIPMFGVRKGEWIFEDLPAHQLIEDVMMFVQSWSQRERQITTRLTMKTLKKKLAELQWAIAVLEHKANWNA